MKRNYSLALLFLLLFLIPNAVKAQAWSGVISTGRAIDWSNVGIPGGIPNRTTQCGSTIAPYGSNGAPADASTINNAIAACPAGQVVSLGAGTFYLNTPINWWSVNNVTLRGQGANSTFIVQSDGGYCGALTAVVCIEGDNSSVNNEKNVCDWTAGYAPGSTHLTFNNCGSTTPAAGAIQNLPVGGVIILDQLDEASDTGTIWNCDVYGSCSYDSPAGAGGGARTDGTCNGATCDRQQQQVVEMVSCVGSNGVACINSTATAPYTVTISPGLYMPNWRSGQKPQASFGASVRTGDGIENLSIDATNVGYGHTIVLFNATNSWVKGVRSLYAPRDHVDLQQAAHCVVRDSYFYQNQSHATVSYGVEFDTASDNLVENNIFQQVTDSTPSTTAGAEGNVAGYNVGINTFYTSSPGWFQASFYIHAGGDAMNLWEGNIGPGFNSDSVHGTHHFETLFRNYLSGDQALCDGAVCYNQTVPISAAASSRYFNIIGNVLGTAGYHTNYTCLGIANGYCASPNVSIYALGYTNQNMGGSFASSTGFCTTPSCTSTSAFDPQTPAYMMRWGNYDTVTAAVRWCGSSSNPGWSTTCKSTPEVPTALASYSNSIPSSTMLPPSFYLASKPAWFGNVPWPAIGPDVGGGNIPGVGGYANQNPAMNCFTTVMGGPVNGSGAALSFNAAACYPQQVGSTPNPPTNVIATVQ